MAVRMYFSDRCHCREVKIRVNLNCLPGQTVALTEKCQTTRPLDNSPQTTCPGSSDSIVDKRTKINLYDVKSWVQIFSGSFGSVVDKRTRG